MRRWTDGKSWSASRVSGSFLTYREMEGNRRSSPERAGKKRSASDDGSDSLKYKAGGLYKQSFSIVTANKLKLHLISYYTKDEIASGRLPQPSTDEQFEDIRIPIHMYPDTTPSGSNLSPAVTTSPLDTPQTAAVRLSPNYDQPPPINAYVPPASVSTQFSATPYQMHTPPQMHCYPPQQQQPQQHPYLALPQIDAFSSGPLVPLPPLYQQNNINPAPPLTKKLRANSPRSEQGSHMPLPSPPSSISSGSSPSNRVQQQASDHTPEESEDRKAINRLDKNLDL